MKGLQDCIPNVCWFHKLNNQSQIFFSQRNDYTWGLVIGPSPRPDNEYGDYTRNRAILAQ